MKVYRLPIRNWNEIDGAEEVDDDGVYRLPIRNWNAGASVGDYALFAFIDYL